MSLWIRNTGIHGRARGKEVTAVNPTFINTPILFLVVVSLSAWCEGSRAQLQVTGRGSPIYVPTSTRRCSQARVADLVISVEILCYHQINPVALTPITGVNTAPCTCNLSVPWVDEAAPLL